MRSNTIVFSGNVWLYPGMVGNWYFISLPKVDSAEIKEVFGQRVRGWGSIRVEVKTGKTTWKTSIFPDKKRGVYILPLKASVRTIEDINVDDVIKITLHIV